MWRACRLVVDTGVHAMGWTRQQMIDYLAANTALSLHEVRDRDRPLHLLARPGALYRIGYLKIRELRARAEKRARRALRRARASTTRCSRNGAVPLPVLERQIERFIAAEKAAVGG